MSVRRYKCAVGDEHDYHVVATLPTERELNKLSKHREEKVLSLSKCDKTLTSLDFLLEWKDLERLRIYGCRFTDFSALQKLRKLKGVFINGLRYKAPDLTFLGGIKSLLSFSLHYAPNLSTFPDISGCRRLRRLVLWDCKRLTDVSNVVKLEGLREFDTLQVDLVPKDLEPVMKMPGIKAVAANFKTREMGHEFAKMLEQYKLVAQLSPKQRRWKI